MPQRIITPEQRQHNIQRFERDWKPQLLKIIQKFDPRVYQIITTADDLPVITEEMGSCFMYGGVGTGKTTKACYFALKWAQIRFENSKPGILFTLVKTAEILQQIRNTFEPNPPVRTQDIIHQFQNIPLLVIDDIGAMSTNDWSYNVLYQIIDYRYSHFLPTFYTSNLSLVDLAKQFKDDRITSRIAHDCKDNIMFFRNKSKRI